MIWLLLGCTTEDTTKNKTTPASPTVPIILTEIQTDNDDIIVHESGEYLDWIELHNPNDTLAPLRGWKVSIDGKNWELPSDRYIKAQSYQIVWLDPKEEPISPSTLQLPVKLDKDRPHTVGLEAPSGTKETVQVPILSSDWSYARYDSGWRIVPPTPADQNQYWSEKMALELQIDGLASAFTSRSAAKELLSDWFSDQGWKAELDKDDGLSKGSLVWRRVYDTRSGQLGLHRPSAYLRYRVEIHKDEVEGNTPVDSGDRDRDLTIKYLRINEHSDSSWMPTTRAEGVDYFEYKREDNQYPCKENAVSVALKAEDLPPLSLKSIAAITPFFPHLAADFALTETTLVEKSQALDWSICWDVDLADDDASVCLRLRYDSLEQVRKDSPPQDAEISWRLKAKKLKKVDVVQASQRLFSQLSTAPFVVQCK